MATFAKYLGVMVGPEADTQAREEALNKYLSAAMALKCRHPPILSCARIYNMEILPILSWQAQVRAPNKRALDIEKYVLQSITGYPYTSILAETYQGLDSLHLPCNFRSLYEVSLASRARVWHSVRAELNDFTLSRRDQG